MKRNQNSAEMVHLKSKDIQKQTGQQGSSQKLLGSYQKDSGIS